MNLKDYTLKITYVADGKPCVLTVDGCTLADGFSNGVFSVKEDGDCDSVHIILQSDKPVELKSAEVIYDHYFATDERFFANGFQSWTISREYAHGDIQKGLSAVCSLPKIREFAGASGDYFFTRYGKNLYHGFTYCYLRNGSGVELLGSLNERTGYTIFYADMDQNVLAAVKDADGVVCTSCLIL